MSADPLMDTYSLTARSNRYCLCEAAPWQPAWWEKVRTVSNVEQQLEHQSACCLSEPHLLSSVSGPAGRGILITGCCWQIKDRDVWGALWSTGKGRWSHTSFLSSQVIQAGRQYQASEGSYRNAWCSWHPGEAASSRKQGSSHCSLEM